MSYGTGPLNEEKTGGINEALSSRDTGIGRRNEQIEENMSSNVKDNLSNEVTGSLKTNTSENNEEIMGLYEAVSNLVII